MGICISMKRNKNKNNNNEANPIIKNNIDENKNPTLDKMTTINDKINKINDNLEQ